MTRRTRGLLADRVSGDVRAMGVSRALGLPLRHPAPAILIFGDKSVDAPGSINVWARRPEQSPDEPPMAGARDTTPEAALIALFEVMIEQLRAVSATKGRS